jgi:murein DD-endopeptidase MepM/ murein hydrolase activator NlpD
MQVGWPGLSRAIAFTIVLTSVFWIALGVWLFRSNVTSDRAEVATRHVPAGPFGSAGFKSNLAPDKAPRAAAPGVTVAFGGSRGLAVPVAGVAPDKLVDTFAQGRAEGARWHDAIDILSPDGTAVLSATPGRIEKLFWSKDGGHTIYIRSADRRTIYYYAHLSAYARDLREGMAVRRGQFIATVGHTGNADPQAPHLHFAVWQADPAQGWSQQGHALDPYPLLTGKAAPAVKPAATAQSSGQASR